MSAATALSAPFLEQLGMVAALGASGGGGVYLVKWLIETATKRLDRREARVDAGSEKLFDNAMGFAQSMGEWGRGLQEEIRTLKGELAACRDEHARSREEMALMRGEIAELRAARDARGLIAQEAQKTVAANRFSEHQREAG